jgi:tetrahydromethanopterin S-methyltransferase subunit G
MTTEIHDSSAQRINDLRSEMNRGFDGVHRRIDDVNSRFDDVNSRFDDVNSRFDRLDEKVEAIRKETRTLFLALIGIVVTMLAINVGGFVAIATLILQNP